LKGGKVDDDDLEDVFDEPINARLPFTDEKCEEELDDSEA
jgi:hypothetical protein